MEGRVTETNSKAAVRGIDCYYPSISLTNFYVQELPKIELVAIASTTKESTSVEDGVMVTNSKAAVRELILIVENPAFSDAHLNSGIV